MVNDIFGHFPKTKCIVKKANGNTFEMQAVEATKGKLMVVSHDAIKPNIIEDNDIIEAIYTNGATNIYKVFDAGYHETLMHIPAHYQIKIEKINNPESLSHGTISNISNSNIIISNNSSHLTAQIKQDLSKFNEIKKAIECNGTISNKEVLLQIIEELKQSVNNKETFQIKYNDLVAALANHITILTPFLPYLASFLP
ncbi:MAG: hypothetical protein LBS73_04065 [Campylobacteraceae bacterium]|jgi:nitrate reductase alpha subunit|nr:hypothetical protein [Campylobacteraceae bacterium]